LFCPLGKTPLYLGQPVALLIFETFDAFDRARLALRDGTFVAFDAVCTHAGCTVGFDAASGILLCPCHDATFDPARNAAVLGGPTDQPLAGLPIVVDAAIGRILLKT